MTQDIREQGGQGVGASVPDQAGRSSTGAATASPPSGDHPSRGVTMTIEASAAYDTFPLGDKPFWAKCVKCSHCWAVAYLPMDMETLAKVTKGGVKCPRCGDNKPVVARQSNGVLASAGEAGTATTVEQGVVHEHAARSEAKGDAQP